MCAVIIVYISIASMSLGFAKQADTKRSISEGSFILSKYLNNFKKYIKGLVIMNLFFLAFNFYEIDFYQKQIGDLKTNSQKGLIKKDKFKEIDQTTTALWILRFNIYIFLIRGIILGIIRA